MGFSSPNFPLLGFEITDLTMDQSRLAANPWTIARKASVLLVVICLSSRAGERSSSFDGVAQLWGR